MARPALAPQVVVAQPMACPALVPQALPPQALAPQALAPQALAPQALAPQALAPQALAPTLGLDDLLQMLGDVSTASTHYFFGNIDPGLLNVVDQIISAASVGCVGLPLHQRLYCEVEGIKVW